MVDRNKDDIILELLQGFKQNNIVLYVGRGTRGSELSQAVCSLNWRCIVTSQTRVDFGREFATDQRKPKRYTQAGELPSNLFDRINLPIIQIYGVDGGVDEGIDDIDDSLMTRLLRRKNAEKIMGRIMARMDVRCRMVVIGYDPDNSHEFPMEAFLPLWYDMTGGSLLFFGMQDVTPELKQFRATAEKRGFSWYGASLQELLAEAAEDAEEDRGGEGQQVDGRNLFYKGKQPVTISVGILLRCRNFAQLLTEEKVYERRPLGRAQQSIWYYNFLYDSAVSPQWYGYLPQTDFYLKRPFEDILVDLVHSMIAGKEMYTSGKVTPIILEGDPGSSKSITLAALAYRIFTERTNPVVYIQNEDLLFNSASSQELEQLDELLYEIERVGVKDMRTLILWDSASYRNVAESAQSLAHQLDNRGRRFVLVCTAYQGARLGKGSEDGEPEEEERDQTCWYVRNGDGTFKRMSRRDAGGDVFFDGRNYFIQSTRRITDREKVQLRQKMKEHLDMEPDVLNRTWKRLEEEGDDNIFIYFYRLVHMIRPNLENRLSNEQRIVSSYVNRQLMILGAREREERDSDNVILQALLKADIRLGQEDLDAVEEEEERTQQEQTYFDLNRFNTCIAMFSRFKLDTPYELGIHMLYKEDSGRQQDFYNNMDLFNLITNDIPWVYYGEDMSGNFVFRFRNALEAEIFLKKNDIGAERQMEIICEMMDYYAKTYQEQGYEDEILMCAIQKILRMIGPNTDYRPFCLGGDLVQEHNLLLDKLDVIIDRLAHMREKLRIPDADASFACIEVTFLREYYGKLWDKLKNGGTSGEADPASCSLEDYVLRLQRLKRASEIALSNMDKLERLKGSTRHGGTMKHILDQINSLAVEISYCNTSLEELRELYEKACRNGEEKTDLGPEDIRPLPYLHQYQMLVRAITSAPTNGYAYNALFNLFEKEYQRSDDEERRLQLLSEVRMIADDASTLEITNRGMNGYDTLSSHIHRIKQYSGGFQVTIESILDKSCSPSFAALFESMLMKNNASGIMFVCQQELDNAGLAGKPLDYKREKEIILTERQLDICRKILDFMKLEEYAPCVERDAYALYLMLRVAWMYYNKRPMSDGREAQLTYIETSHWDEIRQICEKYQECSGINKRPIVTLLHALSLIHLNNDYVRANRMLESLNEDVFGFTARMRVPYIICEAPGIPRIYSGTVLPRFHSGTAMPAENRSGFIHVHGIPQHLGSKTGVRFFMRNLGMQSMPGEKEILNDLELGLGYTGFSVYKEEGRRNREKG